MARVAALDAGKVVAPPRFERTLTAPKPVSAMMAKIKAFEARAKEAAPGEATAAAPPAKPKEKRGAGARRGGVRHGAGGARL